MICTDNNTRDAPDYESYTVTLHYTDAGSIDTSPVCPGQDEYKLIRLQIPLFGTEVELESMDMLSKLRLLIRILHKLWKTGNMRVAGVTARL